MLILRLNSFDIASGDEHVATIWQVSEEREDFSEIFIETAEDPDNLLIKIFNKQTTQGRKYYARARIVTRDAGLSVWSNIDLEIADNIDNSELQVHEPKRVRPPEFIIDDINANNYNHTCFTMRLKKQKLSSTTGLIATTWMIRDEEGKLVFISERNTVDLFDIFVTNILEQRRVYTLEAQYHYANNDNSMIGGITVYTSKSNFTDFIPRTIDGSGNVSGTYNNGTLELNIELDVPVNATDTIIEIYKDDILQTTIHATEYHATDLTYDKNGIITVRAMSIIPTQEQEEWVYRTFILLNRNYNFPYDMPAQLG